ncbi:Glycosyl transferase, group 1 [Nitrospira japonica]|uniref:Glycosyl transferase, group 1 n=1 Tax=Nitrospira japonica TaxID=1325564 RepID=A0A1W1IBD2_9BACT|nr:glycosyltransferase family 4 protein [Nitrospira japonica]SLM50300.1 Glycosyl transferase, group 1 [Nitrospira japonica]
MRIAYLALEAPREGQASYVHVVEIIEGLRRRGHVVELFAPSYSDRWIRPSLAGRLWEHLLIQLRLASRVRQYQLIYVRAHPMAALAARAARIFQVPVVHEVNGIYEDIFVGYPTAARWRSLVTRLWRTQYRHAAGLITVTPQLAGWVKQESGGHQPLSVIPNGANTRLFSPERERYEGLPGRYVVFFGGLAHWHGISTLVAATGDASWPADVSLVIVGDGSGTSTLEQAARDNKKLVLLGRRPYAEVGSVVAGALAGLVPISNPGGRSMTGLAPLKLFETLACGIPAIVSDFPYQAELVRSNHCGLVFPADDGKALAQAVSDLARSPAAAAEMGRRGLDLIRREHSWDARAAQTDMFLHQVVASFDRRHPDRLSARASGR